MSRTYKRRRGFGVGALMLAVGLVAASCGSSDSKSQGTSSTTEAKARPAVTIEADEFSFTAPATIPAGYVDITLKNSGTESHHIQFVKLNSVSKADFKAAISATDIGALDEATFVGGPNGADPGGSATATVKLDPGSYEIVCVIPTEDGTSHASHGMIATVEVKKTAASVETAPETAGTIVLGDFVFEPPKGFDGHGTYAVENQGNQVHELAMFKYADGATLEDVTGFLLSPPGSPPPAGPPPFSEAEGLVGLSTNERAWLTFDLAPGKYAMVCFFPDPTKDDIPHAVEGMIKEVTVT